MLNYPQAALLGLLQGVSELFPISSLGHTVLIPAVLGWDIDRSSDFFVSFLVLTHLATALVLLAVFWRDWLNIVIGVLRSIREREIRETDTYAKLGWLIIVSTIPAGALGLFFEEALQVLFSSTALVATALALNGMVLLAIERLRRRRSDEIAKANDQEIAGLSYAQAVLIGCAQCLALLPGFSRTGLAITGGLASGLGHENAGRYAFLLATPIILAAALLKLPGLFVGGQGIGEALVGAACAAIAAYASVRFLLKYFRTKNLRPFAIYCVTAGFFAIVLTIQI
jgi:undecaprenyl-diphosphatase